MSWQITLDDRKFLLDDLPGTTIQRIASKCDVGWFDLVLSPGQNLNAFVDLIGEVAKQMDTPTPLEAGSGVGAIRDFLINQLERVDDDRPRTWDRDGNPLAEDAPETDGSSTSPASTDGLPTSSEDSPTET